MQLKWRNLLMQLRQYTTKCKALFQVKWCIWASESQRFSKHDPYEVLVEIPDKNLDIFFQSGANKYVELLWLIGCTIQPTTPKQQIPNGCICRLNFYRAGQLIFQKHLMLRVKCVEKMSFYVDETAV